MDLENLSSEAINARADALKYLPKCGITSAVEYLLNYFEALGDKEMTTALRKMQKLKKNQVIRATENAMYSAFDPDGIRERVREKSKI